MKSNPTLAQNKPNLFNSDTVIAFIIPQTVIEAYLFVYDMNGTQKMKKSINGRGEGSVMITGNDLIADIYMYSLIHDGE